MLTGLASAAFAGSAQTIALTLPVGLTKIRTSPREPAQPLLDREQIVGQLGALPDEDEVATLGLERRHFLGLLSGGDLQRRLVRSVENGEQLVEFALRDRVVLVIVAAGATECQPQKRGPRRADPIDHGLNAKLLRVRPTFLVHHCVPVKAGGDLLIDSSAGEHVARQLLDRELIEGQIAI